jgi:hypothetical protein
VRSLLVLVLVAGCGVDSSVSRTVGARCDDKDDCEERCLVDADDYPGGICSVSCLDVRDCPGDTACVDAEGGVCLFVCETNADCEFMGPGWECNAIDALPDGSEQVMVCRG